MNPTNPLDQLRDMHLPPPPGFWPPAPGWWLLALLAVALTAMALWWWRQRRSANRYRREALALLNSLTNQQDFSLNDIVQLIRRTAKTANPKTSWHTLPAAALLQKLDEFNKGALTAAFASSESEDPQVVFSNLAATLYSGKAANHSQQQQEVLIKAARRWIATHKRGQLL